MTTMTFDPAVGTGFTMTANGWVKTELVEAFIAAEAARLAKQTPAEPEFA